VTHTRYHGVAIGLHWLIALLVISLIGIGKHMTGLDESDSTRYALTQWHKSLGITILLLMVVRLLWRATHRPPALPRTLKPWEQRAAGITHGLVYLLLFALPLTGWIMVSASPLNLPTLLYQVFPWPHLPLFAGSENKQEIFTLFQSVHEIISSLLIVLLLAHIGAAMRHHFLLRDGVMSRMSPRILRTDELTDNRGRWVPGIGHFVAAITLVTVGVIALGFNMTRSVPFTAGDSDVGFSYILFGSENQGVFAESTVDMRYDKNNLSASSLTAVVTIASLTTGDRQIDSTLVEPDWFDAATQPEAKFTSVSLKATDENTVQVEGVLTIKSIEKPVSFPLTIIDTETEQQASGGFTINRLDFALGETDQPGDSTIGYDVTINFSFALNQESSE